MEAGDHIGNYVVRALLGQGGMGAVYLAQHTVIGRQVAIKVLKREHAGDETAVARFVNEARAKSLVGHPGIVDVFDFGSLPSGAPYLVMEYLEGQSLAQRIARAGALPIIEATSIAWQTASALAAAHARGIIHRDLKPENLFLARDPGGLGAAQVKVLDFGIAKLRADLQPAPTATQSGALVGTPVYMSPEQCRGARELVDHRADIYSLGVILYEMVCGRPPFQGEGFTDLLFMHLQTAPPRPSSVNPSVPPALEAIILRALAKRREDRFAAMTELREALVVGVPEAAGEIRAQTTPLGVTRPGPITMTPSPVAGSAPGRRGSRRGLVLAVVLGVMATALVVFATYRPGTAPSKASIPPPPIATPEPEPLPAPVEPVAEPAPPPAVKSPVAAPHKRPVKKKKKKRARPEPEVKQW